MSAVIAGSAPSLGTTRTSGYFYDDSADDARTRAVFTKSPRAMGQLRAHAARKTHIARVAMRARRAVTATATPGQRLSYQRPSTSTHAAAMGPMGAAMGERGGGGGVKGRTDGGGRGWGGLSSSCTTTTTTTTTTTRGDAAVERRRRRMRMRTHAEDVDLRMRNLPWVVCKGQGGGSTILLGLVRACRAMKRLQNEDHEYKLLPAQGN